MINHKGHKVHKGKSRESLLVVPTVHLSDLGVLRGKKL